MYFENKVVFYCLIKWLLWPFQIQKKKLLSVDCGISSIGWGFKRFKEP